MWIVERCTIDDLQEVLNHQGDDTIYHVVIDVPKNSCVVVVVRNEEVDQSTECAPVVTEKEK